MCLSQYSSILDCEGCIASNYAYAVVFFFFLNNPGSCNLQLEGFTAGLALQFSRATKTIDYLP